jgi:acetyltransferase-like isoleucine patch superfamily enzyme
MRSGRHPAQYRHLSREALGWVLRHRAFGPGYLLRYWRLLVLRLTHPDVVTRGLVFLGRGVVIETAPGQGLLDLGAFVHIGDRCALRAHEGVLRIGDKAVLGADVRINCWLDIEMGDACLVADWTYVADFDHVHTDPARAIKDQGIAKTPVRVGSGSWLGVRTTVLRGTSLGTGTVVAAHSVVRGVHPDHVVLAGAPARPVADRIRRWQDDAARRRALADLAAWHDRLGRDPAAAGVTGIDAAAGGQDDTRSTAPAAAEPSAGDSEQPAEGSSHGACAHDPVPSRRLGRLRPGWTGRR